jgi:hypothetical protein
MKDNFDLKKYLANNILLKESNGGSSSEDIQALKDLTTTFWEGHSIIDPDRLYTPYRQEYDLNTYTPNQDEEWMNKINYGLNYFLEKPSGVMVFPDIFDTFLPPPGAPQDAFYTRITINQNDQTLNVETPYIDSNRKYYVGWFGSDKKYYPDTTNFNEDVEYIG